MREPPEVIRRLPEQAFTRMLAAAAAAQAEPGPRFIDLGRGNPDLPPPANAIAAVHAALDVTATPEVHGYPPFQGEPSLRAAIADRYRERHGVFLDPEREVAVVPGTKTGIMLACLAAAERDATVALPDPGYPDYLSGTALAGARVAPLALAGPDLQPDWDTLAPDAALVVLNFPSNPTAAVERPGTFERAIAEAERRRAWVLHDLAYGFLSFDGDGTARSVLEADGARERAVELWSPSKVFGMAGWRVGFLVGAPDLVGRVKLLVDHLTAGVPTALQRGLHAALTDPARDDDERRRARIYRARRDRLATALRIPPPAGTFYGWWRLPDGLTVERIAAEARVGVAPGEAFGAAGEGHARLSLALPDADLDEALARLRGLLASG